MSKEKIQICEDLADIMPPEYQELVATATFGNQDRGWKDIGSSKELIEQHSLCAGCPESIAFRYILASLPAPEDTVFVGSTGCTSLVFPHVAVHNIHSLFGNQNAIASGLKRTLASRFPDVEKDVVVLAGDGATVDIGDRKSTRLNSSHALISYAVFCLKKKRKKTHKQCVHNI